MSSNDDLIGDWIDATRKLVGVGSGGLLDGLSALSHAANVAQRPSSESSQGRVASDPGLSQGSAEREARHELEGAMLAGLADALEARYRGNELAEELEAHAAKRAPQGFGEDGEPIGYDLAAFGMHTLTTFLKLNARANRKVVAALQRAAEARGDNPRTGDGEPVEQPLATIELSHGSGEGYKDSATGNLRYLGRFQVANRRGRWLGGVFESEIELDFGAAEGSATAAERPKLKLEFVPPRIDLAPGEVMEVVVRATTEALEGLTEALPLEPRLGDDARIHTGRGDVVLAGPTHGRHAAIPLRMVANLPSTEKLFNLLDERADELAADSDLMTELASFLANRDKGAEDDKLLSIDLGVGRSMVIASVRDLTSPRSPLIARDSNEP